MKKKKVAIQGIKGAFHEIAAKKFFGENIEIVEAETFKILCKNLVAQKVDYAVMAIENTIAGSLLENYRYINEFRLKVVGEEFLHIQMHLLAHPETNIHNIEQIESHPIAIRQCRDYLETLSPKIKIVENTDTALVAHNIRTQNLQHTAAIASEDAAKLYNLNILEQNIHTNKKNFTRFLILSLQANNDARNNKSTICFEVTHRIGALADVLNVFTQHNINLTMIQSLPIIGQPYQYSFYADIEWNDYDSYNAAISTMLRSVASLSVIGEYQKKDFHKL